MREDVNQIDVEDMMLDVVMMCVCWRSSSPDVYKRHDAFTCAFCGTIVHLQSSALLVYVSNRATHENIEGIRESIYTYERHHSRRKSNGWQTCILHKVHALEYRNNASCMGCGRRCDHA